jgi:peptidoglycan hydrolase CwlO-like protein
VKLNLGTLAALDAVDFQSASDPSGGGKSWTSGPTGVAMTGSQQVQLQQIRDRDAEFDQDLDEIGEGIQDLHELALRQGEEVQRQNQMLNEVGSKIDAAHEHMVNVNAKMKDTLNEVGRSSDKLCVDIMCIVLGIGLAAAMYKLATGKGSF